MDRIADSNPRYLIGEKPFHWAAQEGHQKFCHLIIENTFFDKNAKDARGVAPFHVTAMKGNLDLCKIIILNVKIQQIILEERHFILWVARLSPLRLQQVMASKY